MIYISLILIVLFVQQTSSIPIISSASRRIFNKCQSNPCISACPTSCSETCPKPCPDQSDSDSDSDATAVVVNKIQNRLPIWLIIVIAVLSFIFFLLFLLLLFWLFRKLFKYLATRDARDDEYRKNKIDIKRGAGKRKDRSTEYVESHSSYSALFYGKGKVKKNGRSCSCPDCRGGRGGRGGRSGRSHRGDRECRKGSCRRSSPVTRNNRH